MPSFLASKIVNLERDPSIATIPQLPSAVPAFVGLCERGTLVTPTEVSSWSEYTDSFGSFWKMSAAAGGGTAHIPLAVRNFFLNGGRKCYVSRCIEEGVTSGAIADISATYTSGATAVDALIIEAKNKGTWGNSLVATIATASSGDADEYKLTLKKSSVVVETWDNLPKGDAEAVINSTTEGSTYIAVTDSKTAVPVKKDWTLAGGLEGGAPDDGTYTAGINTLDSVEDCTLLAVPDSSSSAVQGAMIIYCETTRNGLMFAVLDPAASQSASQIVTTAQALSSSEFWAMYWPRLRIPNPNTTVFSTEGEFVVVPPSGFVCGVMARNDAKYLAGPFVQPAGVDDGRVFGPVDFETDNHVVKKESTRDTVYPEKINPITFMKGYGIFIDGTKVGKITGGNFMSVGERRGVSAIERNLKSGLQWVRHKNNTEGLRGKVERSVYGEMLTWTENGALGSRDPSQAFAVDVDVPGVGLNNARVRAQRRLYVQLGIATAQPTDFVIILVSQDMRAIQEATKGLMA